MMDREEALTTALGVAFNIEPEPDQLHLFELELASQGFVLMPVADVWDQLPPEDRERLS